MPASDQYKVLTIRNTQHSISQSVIFSSLLAQFDDSDAFSDLFSNLFGESSGMMAKLCRLQKELGLYQKTGEFPGSLLSLIEQHFLPKLVGHLKQNGTTFLHASVVEQIESSAQGIEQGKVDVIVQQALAHLLKVSIHIYSQSAHHLSLNATIGKHSLTVSVLEEGEIYQPLINEKDLNEEQKNAFNAKPLLTFKAAETGLNTSETLNEAALKLLVQETLNALPGHLVTISRDVPPAPVFNPLLSSTELRLTRGDVPTSDLALRNLGDIQDELTTLRLAYQSSVVLFEGDSVESILTWAASLTTTLITGMLGGTTGLGLAAGVAEGIVIGTGGALGVGTLAVSVACVPAFITCTLLTLIGGVVGKSYAQEYKEALKNANQHLSAGRYNEAAVVLEAEFNRWGIVRMLRTSFLTKAHYAVAHFFRGMCAENMQDLPKAYTEYQQALNDAKETDAKIVRLLLQIKLIQFLRMHASALSLSPQQRPEALIKTHVDELNHYFKESLTDLHWQVHNSMLSILSACTKHTQFSRQGFTWLQGVLNIQSLFILDGYHGGHGNYQQVVYSFFQAVTVAYLHFNDESVIREGELLQPIDRNNSISYVIRKLTETFNKYNSFRTAYPNLAKQPAYRQCHDMMKNFTLRFGTILKKRIGTLNPSGSQEFHNNLPALVGVSLHEFNQLVIRHDQSIQFLLSLEAEFDLHFDSIDAWLKKLCDAKQQCHTVVSQRNQMNMLHMLAQLPGGLVSDPDLVWIAAERMKDMINTKNNNNQTPYALLRQNDPYSIKIGIQDPKLMLKINNPALTTAGSWYNFGQNYYLGQNGKVRSEASAIGCFKLSIEKDEKHVGSLYNLGMIFQYGQCADINSAKAYYKRAVLQNHAPSKIQLFILDHAERTVEQWFELGNDYYARDLQTQDYCKAEICFKQVIKLNPEHSLAHLFLGKMYQYGRGVTIDLAQAKDHYDKSAKAGSTEAAVQLLQVNNPSLKTADSWYNLGQDYYLGRNGKVRSESSAMGCFELASGKDEKHVDSLYSLGIIFQYGQCADLNRAKKYYERAVLQNHEPSKIQLLIINHPKLHGIKNQHSQIHVVQLELRLKKITSFYPWVFDANYSPSLPKTNIDSLSDDMEYFYSDFLKTYEQYKTAFEARVCTIKNEPSTSQHINYDLARNNFIKSAQGLWKRLERYRLQIITWQDELLGPNTPPCQDELNIIDRYVIEFDQMLGQLSDFVLNMPSYFGGRSHFFSLGHYLSTLSSRYSIDGNPISSYVSEKIDGLQRIVYHPRSSEIICLVQVLALIREIEAQRTAPHLLMLLNVAINYTEFSNPGPRDAAELQLITQELHLPGLSIVP